MDVCANLQNDLRTSGFSFVSAVGKGLNNYELAERLGFAVGPSCTDNILTISRKTDGNTYSGLFGNAAFPLHTDCAHWLDPPRLILLNCISGDPSVSTVLADSRQLISELSARALSKALVRQRRPIEGKRNLMALLEYPDCEQSRLRWDSVFIEPASSSSAHLFTKVSAAVSSLPTVEIVLREPGDVLIVDNWRMLHGRSAAGETADQRLIRRTYLEGFK